MGFFRLGQLFQAMRLHNWARCIHSMYWSSPPLATKTKLVMGIPRTARGRFLAELSCRKQRVVLGGAEAPTAFLERGGTEGRREVSLQSTSRNMGKWWGQHRHRQERVCGSCRP